MFGVTTVRLLLVVSWHWIFAYPCCHWLNHAYIWIGHRIALRCPCPNYQPTTTKVSRTAWCSESDGLLLTTAVGLKMQVSRWSPSEADEAPVWARWQHWLLAFGVLLAVDRGLAGLANLIRVVRAVQASCRHRAPHDRSRGPRAGSARPEARRERSSSPVPGFAVPLCSHGRAGYRHPATSRKVQEGEECDE